jgi:thiamine-phosphate pyrophosphorylase
MQLAGFYAVLDRDDETLARKLASVACALQVRLKPRAGGMSIDTATTVRVARMARRVCDHAGIPLIVNDRVDLALAVGADGVHLGQTDLPIADARRIARTLVIGVSTHDPVQARAACDAGADYIGYGPIFSTATKANPDPVQGLEGLRVAAGIATVPIVAIGGIAPATARDVFRAGATAICAIGSVNEAKDPEAAARAIRSGAD